LQNWALPLLGLEVYKWEAATVQAPRVSRLVYSQGWFSPCLSFQLVWSYPGFELSFHHKGSTGLMSKDDPICWLSSSKRMVSGAAKIVVALLQEAAAASVTN
jgi:hypothetical protein